MTPKPLYVICDKDGKYKCRQDYMFENLEDAEEMRRDDEVVVKYLPEGKKTWNT